MAVKSKIYQRVK